MLAAAAALPRMRAHGLQILREHPVAAEQSLDTHGRRDVGQFQQPVQVAKRQHQHAEHAVGAVDQCQPLLLGEHDRFDAVPGQRVGGRQQFAVRRAYRTLAYDGQRHVGQRREIAGAAKAAVLVDDGRQPSGQHRRIRLGDLGPHTGAAGGQCRQPQQHHGPDDFAFDLGTRSGSV